MRRGVKLLRPEVLVIGAGPAGLTVAAELAPRLAGEVLVLEREQVAGGIPRHSNHLGYGLRDMKTFISGPSYASRLRTRALEAGAVVRTEAMVTGWESDSAVRVTTPDGLFVVDPRAIVLATGARERPRPARLVPGSRPAGVYTTGELQNMVHLHHQHVGTKAVIVGAELVSWSSVMTLKEAGVKPVLMITGHRKPESYALFNLGGKAIFRTRIATRSRMTRIIGSPRVEAVEIEDLDSGARSLVECDTVVFTGDWIPDYELAEAAGLVIDRASKAPLVDMALRTSRTGVFAAGNLLHPVDTADVAALDGVHVARQVLAYLTTPAAPIGAGVRIRAAPPLRWVSPGIWRPEDPPPARHRLSAWSDAYIARPVVTVSQAGEEIAHRRLPWAASPGRVFRIPSSILNGVDPARGDVTVSIRQKPPSAASAARVCSTHSPNK
jgi:thioredoxin reductase